MSRDRLLGKSAVVVLLAVVAIAAAGGAADDPLTTADVVRFLRAGLSERTILVELRDRGFGEMLDATHEAALRAAGATETLVVAIRRVAPAAPLVEPAVTVTPRPRDYAAPPPKAEGPRGLTFGAST